ncbi:MAG: flagellar protein FlaG, partial [Beijerinckiaceae bacterium]
SAAPVVKTVMPESKAVTAVPEKPAVRVEISGDAQRLAAAQQAMKRVIEKHIAYDEKMRTVIVKTVDQVTGKTVSQLPDKVSMQLRAYMRDFIEKTEAQKAEGHRRVEATA